ncbi:nitrate reductase NapD [Thalassospira sp. MBR-102]|jgi:nitrate reductase NapD|uniref:Chaperone NapD n=1 Tax=Thalassospira xiamenensis M-5 = DSM 17429 TaxID=1123366 RepID=A0AB72UGT2_9PROT|nr:MULTISPECIES: chaperone NapD [Thalassospira]MBR9779856.1 chaperone NapD [Rhodospirillales bacterium]AJD53400.1 nitrate reductase accessory protein [Thalassospira xiamenensis M-5 = DSM 17429]MAB31424.1 hypothetical protein [Thalassospira sp.]MBA05643.1 hypothetical protein [Thalassospira sp.]MBL4840204.1 chaperone NapD [Thalassospira sp.]|tara:strand:+ start:1376 stop:1627 length:252 start_codon:yes stop_codon:yes gene_type:complete
MDDKVGVISSMIIQSRPENMTAIKAALLNMPDTEISADDPSGKIVVVMEAASDRQLADGMKEIGDIPGVLGVNLVFHHNENAQ